MRVEQYPLKGLSPNMMQATRDIANDVRDPTSPRFDGRTLRRLVQREIVTVPVLSKKRDRYLYLEAQIAEPLGPHYVRIAELHEEIETVARELQQAEQARRRQRRTKPRKSAPRKRSTQKPRPTRTPGRLRTAA